MAEQQTYVPRSRRVWWHVRDTAIHPMATVKYYVARTVGRAVCARYGHAGDEISRMLGFCPRCYGDLPTNIWREMAKQRAAEEAQQRRTQEELQRILMEGRIADAHGYQVGDTLYTHDASNVDESQWEDVGHGVYKRRVK